MSYKRRVCGGDARGSPAPEEWRLEHTERFFDFLSVGAEFGADDL